MAGKTPNNEKILIVDDNKENLKLLKTYLNDAGYEVVIASGGNSAIDRALRIRPTLILLDVKMPDMDGFTACLKLKEYKKLETIPVIFVTASNEPESIEHGFEVGGIDYITKPIKKVELLARVKNHIQIVRLNNYLENELADRTQALKDSEKRFRLAIDGTQDGLWDLNLDTKEAFISNRYETMLGYEPGELPRTDQAWLGLLHPEDFDVAKRKLEMYFSKQTEYYESTFRMRAKDGTYRWIVGRGKAEFDEKGMPVRITGFNTDITERKKAEQELIRAKEKAEESDRLKTAFLNNLSHEIRTPMNGIVGFADLLKTKGLSKEKQQSFIDTIEKSGNRMLNLINDLIDVSRIESGQVSLLKVSFNVNQLIDDALTFFSPYCYDKNLKIEAHKDLPDERAEIIMDKTKVEQVLSNLIINAIKFTPQGAIDFGYEQKESFLQFWVRDTGIGIPDDKYETIFERFRRIDTRNYQAEGSGLGLSICKAYAEILGGEIWVKSKICEGSVFYFTLPYTPLESKGNIDMSKNENRNFKGKVILIAEDDSTNFLYLKEIFDDYEIQILYAKDGQEALELFKNNKVDIALVDIKMPMLNGYDLLREIRKTDRLLPVIAQTAYASEEEKIKCIKMGFTGFVSKPYKSELIIDEVSKLL